MHEQRRMGEHAIRIFCITAISVHCQQVGYQSCHTELAVELAKRSLFFLSRQSMYFIESLPAVECLLPEPALNALFPDSVPQLDTLGEGAGGLAPRFHLTSKIQTGFADHLSK